MGRFLPLSEEDRKRIEQLEAEIRRIKNKYYTP
jgi:restriction endonuclease S subunit